MPISTNTTIAICIQIHVGDIRRSLARGTGGGELDDG
jgi:hypothetical protein